MNEEPKCRRTATECDRTLEELNKDVDDVMKRIRTYQEQAIKKLMTLSPYEKWLADKDAELLAFGTTTYTDEEMEEVIKRQIDYLTKKSK